jgi:hypothetical protein
VGFIRLIFVALARVLKNDEDNLKEANKACDNK